MEALDKTMSVGSSFRLVIVADRPEINVPRVGLVNENDDTEPPV
jgi:hypothetical protein